MTLQSIISSIIRVSHSDDKVNDLYASDAQIIRLPLCFLLVLVWIPIAQIYTRAAMQDSHQPCEEVKHRDDGNKRSGAKQPAGVCQVGIQVVDLRRYEGIECRRHR